MLLSACAGGSSHQICTQWEIVEPYQSIILLNTQNLVFGMEYFIFTWLGTETPCLNTQCIKIAATYGDDSYKAKFDLAWTIATSPNSVRILKMLIYVILSVYNQSAIMDYSCKAESEAQGWSSHKIIHVQFGSCLIA